jgi:hypothetical protein
VLVEPAAAAIIALRTGRGSDDRIQSVERYNLDEKGIGLPPVVLQPNEFAPNKAPVVNPVNPQPQPKGPAAPPIPGLPAAKPAAPGKDK